MGRIIQPLLALTPGSRLGVDEITAPLGEGGMGQAPTGGLKPAPTLRWSGMRIAFNSNRSGTYNLYVKSSDGSGAEARLGPPANNKAPMDWSRDGRWRTPPRRRRFRKFSPDGRWVAYQTNESPAGGRRHRRADYADSELES